MNDKKKLIRLESNKALSQIYDDEFPDGFSFAFVGKEERKEEGLRIKPVNTPFINCRDTICTACRAQVNSDKTMPYWTFDPNENPIDMSKLRLALSVGTKATEVQKEKIFSGKRVLNLLEEEAGWEKSIISSVVHTKYGKKCSMWLLTGPEQWIKVSAMLSLVGLIMRIAYKHGPINSDSLEEFKSHIGKLARPDMGPDLQYLHNVKEYILPLIRNYDKIFTGDIKTYYPKASNSLMGNGGINALVKRQFSYSNKIDENLDKYVFKPIRTK